MKVVVMVVALPQLHLQAFYSLSKKAFVLTDFWCLLPANKFFGQKVSRALAGLAGLAPDVSALGLNPGKDFTLNSLEYKKTSVCEIKQLKFP